MRGVVSVGWQGVSIPFLRPYTTFGIRATHRLGLLLWLRLDNGMVGVGEASPVGTGSRIEIEELANQLEDIANSWILGADLGGSAIWHCLDSSDSSRALHFGVETALLDLMGKAKECSVGELLGGSPRPLPVNALIAAETPEEALIEVMEGLKSGFSSFKVKVAIADLERDEEVVSNVRQSIGPTAQLRIDPNQGWSVEQAITSIQLLAQYNLEYVEQPVRADDLPGLSEVARQVSVPIGADEAASSKNDVSRLIADNRIGLVILKAGRLGGLRTAADTVRLALEGNKKVVITSSLEAGVGVTASAHLATILKSHPFAHGLSTNSLLESNLVSSPLLPSKGMLSLPAGHGLGISIDTDALARYSIDVRGSAGIK